jgi:hypothetical protein
MPRTRHKWSQPDRRSAELTVRTCTVCGLQAHSHHEWKAIGAHHWKTYHASVGDGFVALDVMPECDPQSIV